MKKLVVIAVAIVASMACGQVQAQDNKLGLNDIELQLAKFEQTHFVNKCVYSVGSDAYESTAGELAIDGASFGITGGVQSFDGHVVPFIGGLVNWEGGKKVPLGFELMVTVNQGNYTEYADRNNPYPEVNFKGIAKLRLFTSHDKKMRLYIDPYFSYKKNFDYHEYISTTETIVENEQEIVRTKDVVESNVEVKASTKGYGAMLEFVYTPFMSRHSFRIFAGGGRQQRFYADGNGWHTELFAGVKWSYNFSAAEIWDKDFLQKTGLTKSQVKKLSKQSKQTVKWY